MAMWFAITLYVALMTTPAGQDRFTISLQGQKKMMEFTRQADGQWAVQQLPVRPENLKDESGFVRLDGTRLIMTKPAQGDRPAKENIVDMKEMVTIPAAPEWAKIEKLVLKNGGGTVLLKRDGNSVTLSQDEKGFFPAPGIIRWEKKP